MGYFKSVAIDEMREVFIEIAQEYDVSVDEVWAIYREADFAHC